MSEKTRKGAPTCQKTYAHTLVNESTHEVTDIHRQFHHANFEYTLYPNFLPLWFSQKLPLKFRVAKTITMKCTTLPKPMYI